MPYPKRGRGPNQLRALGVRFCLQCEGPNVRVVVKSHGGTQHIEQCTDCSYLRLVEG